MLTLVVIERLENNSSGAIGEELTFADAGDCAWGLELIVRVKIFRVRCHRLSAA